MKKKRKKTRRKNNRIEKLVQERFLPITDGKKFSMHRPIHGNGAWGGFADPRAKWGSPGNAYQVRT